MLRWPLTAAEEERDLIAAIAASLEVSAGEGAAASPAQAAAADEAVGLAAGIVLVALADGTIFIPLPLPAAVPTPLVEAARTREASGLPAGGPEDEPEPSPALEAVRARFGIPAARLRRAHEAGAAARPKLSGSAAQVPPTLALPGVPKDDKRCLVLLRARAGLNVSGFFEGRYRAGFAAYVEQSNGAIDPGAVFHGWASQTEAVQYWLGAGQRLPWPLLPPRI